MKRYIYFQPNDKDIKDTASDCVIRAVCKAFNMDWLTAFDNLCVYARKNQCLPNGEKATKPFFEENGWHYTSIKRGAKKTVIDLAKAYKGINPIIANVRVGFGTHYVAIQEGKYFDTWDCGDRYVYGYWSKEE